MKQLIKRIFEILGYEIHKKVAPHDTRGFNAVHLAKIAKPRTVIDVGVAYGTFPLYQAFPQAKFILVEPLREYEAVIGKICSQYDCKVYFQAVGRAPGIVEFTVDTEDLKKSSFQKRSALTATGNVLETRRVEVTTLDTILQDNPNMPMPILLKLDTEGHEMAALQGATELLRMTETVIAEVSVAKRFADSYEFEDLLLYMKKNGFRLFDILTIAGSEVRPRFMDVVFKRVFKRDAS